MTELMFFSDPHLGLKRSSHTTTASRERLRQAINNQVSRLLSAQYTNKFCLGDLFDTFKVDPEDMLIGADILQQCQTVLTGNHDVSNRADQMSTMQALKTLFTNELTTVQYVSSGHSKNGVITVNHCLTQGGFEEALLEAEQLTERSGVSSSILLLHCNYNSPFATDESSLNLTVERAEKLLETFQYILIGHEHQSAIHLDGRVVLVGNIHPTSFADISDKYYWTLESTEDGFDNLTQHRVWDAGFGSVALPWEDMSEVLSQADGVPETVQFIEVTGEADPRHMPTIAKQIADLWKMSNNLLMVKNSVRSLELTPQIGDQLSTARCVDIPKLVAGALEEKPQLKQLWSEYLGRVNAEIN